MHAFFNKRRHANAAMASAASPILRALAKSFRARLQPITDARRRRLLEIKAQIVVLLLVVPWRHHLLLVSRLT